MAYTFEQLPEAIAGLQVQLNRIEQLLTERSTVSKEPEILTIKQAAEFLDLAVQTVYQRVSSRTIPFSKRGKRLYFQRHELEQWISEGRKQTRKEIVESV